MQEFIHGGVREISEGPYGYILLGLVYLWDDITKSLKIEKVILVEVDLKLKYTVEISFYYDMFARPYKGIYEENGTYFYNGTPVINYKDLNIPETLTGVVEKEDWLHHDYNRFFYNHNGYLKYSVNPVCTDYSSPFRTQYTELYSCILSFDEKTMTGSGVGFDVLGKIQKYNYMTDIDELYRELANEKSLKYRDPDKEGYKRVLEQGLLNMSYKTDELGNRVYTYHSIWE